MSSTIWHTQFVFPGVCQNTNTCVFEKTDCPGGGGDYLSPRQILNGMSGLGGTGPGANCMPNPNSASQVAIIDMLDNVNFGRCSDRNGNSDFCTSTAAACGNFVFSAKEDGCRAYDDLAVGSPVRNTIFGKCGTECAWSSTDCDGVYTSAAATINDSDKCLSEDVRVGACKAPGNDQYFYCAVSANACDSASNFVSAQDLALDGISCRLTEGSLPRSTTYKTYTGDSGSGGNTDPSPPPAKSSSDKNKTAIIAGSVVGGVVGLALIAGIICWCSRRRGGSQKEATPATTEGSAKASEATGDEEEGDLSRQIS